jgi:HK97 family phage prohead protease
MYDLIKLADIELVDLKKYGVRGYASVTDVLVPGFREVVEPGAFGSVLSRIDRLPITYNHDLWDRLQIGYTTYLAEDDTGLYFEGLPVPTLHAAFTLSSIGAMGRMPASFMFRAGETWADDDGINHIESFSDVIELGPVIIGANPRAYIELMPIGEATEGHSKIDQIISALESASETIQGVATL